MPESGALVVTGGLAAMPVAGVAWQVLHYLEGFRRLGFRVTYLEDSGVWPFDPERGEVTDDVRPALAYVRRMLERVGLGDAWAYRDVLDGRVHGLSEKRLAAVLGEADALVNISGVTVLADEHLQVPVRVFIETDPVLAQIEIAQGNERTAAMLSAHTHLLTYGENFGAPDCTVPIEHFDYVPTRQPVILDWWQARGTPQAPLTTITSWRQTSKDIEWQGELLTWSKDVQFGPFLDLPDRVDHQLELALATADQRAIAMLRTAGWSVIPAQPLSDDVDRYRDYIQASAGEFSVAKAQYSRLRSGWFSDRTATYLAAGRPAVVQDCGSPLPGGEGLFMVDTATEAAAAIEAIDADPARHRGAALELADAYLRAEVVLERLCADVGLA